MKENWTYRRGDIYLANLNPYIGSEQGGTRPVLLLQNNKMFIITIKKVVSMLLSTVGLVMRI